LLIIKVTRTTCYVLLYYTNIAHTFAHIFVECFCINYVSKSNCKNSMLFVCIIVVSGIPDFVITVSISSTYCHETARDATFGLRNGNKYFIKKFFFVLDINFTFQTRINTCFNSGKGFSNM